MPPITWAFEAGLPDPATFPLDDLARLAGEVVHDDPVDALQYARSPRPLMTYGDAGLRAALVERVARLDGITLDPWGVMLTSGAVHGIELALEAFLDPGDAVAVEAPTWNHVLTTVARLGAHAVAVPMDDDGLRVDLLEAALEAAGAGGRRIKVLYTIATFHTPTGITLPAARRRALVELAERHDLVIIEDDVYRELRYDGEAVPSMLAMPPTGRVVRVGSFSKVVAPGLRVGWLSGAPELLEAVAAVRDDLGVGQLVARVMARYVTDGLLDPHVAEVNVLYRHKRDVAQAALAAACGDLVRWCPPEGGIFLWLELDERVDAAAAGARALEGGVMCRPGERFFGDGGGGAQHLRLAFAPVPEAEIERGIAVLGEAVRSSLR